MNSFRIRRQKMIHPNETIDFYPVFTLFFVSKCIFKQICFHNACVILIMILHDKLFNEFGAVIWCIYIEIGSASGKFFEQFI